jgi:hypothetical protein
VRSGALSLHYLGHTDRAYTGPRALSESLPNLDGGARVDRCIDRSLRYLSVVPRGSTAAYGRFFCISTTAADVESHTIGLHSLGMEWKEHVAWFAPISITLVAFVFIQYGRDLKNHRLCLAKIPICRRIKYINCSSIFVS